MKNLKIMVQNSNITERQLTYIAMKSKSRDGMGKGFPHPCVTNLKLHDESETSILMQDAFMCYLKHWIN